MKSIKIVVFYDRSTANFHIYQGVRRGGVAYVPRADLGANPPDALVGEFRLPTEADLKEMTGDEVP